MAADSQVEVDEQAEVALGRQAADDLSHSWPDVSRVPERVTEAWARGAMERFAELIREQRAIFRHSQVKSEQGAARISPRPFQGVLEAMQNADDLGAKELRLMVRLRRRGRELLIVHDGDPVRLHHVGAMVIPWMTTKDDDSETSGRFGIGQKTLRSLGGPIELHGAPFHVRLDTTNPVTCAPLAAISGFYDPFGSQTLLRIPLHRGVDADALREYVVDLGAAALLFLRSLRRLSFWDPEAERRIVDRRLTRSAAEPVPVRVGGRRLTAERVLLRDPSSRRRYLRYEVQVPLTADERRTDKATGTHATLGIALPLGGTGTGAIYDRVPMPIATGFPCSLNAQLEPDTGRSALVQGDPWNERRLADLGELLGAVTLDAFAREPASAWNAIPLMGEVPDQADAWLQAAIRSSVFETAQALAVEGLRVPQANGDALPLSESTYEDAALDGLLTPEDFAYLRPGYAPVGEPLRDRHARWRRVLDEVGECDVVPVADAIEVLEQTDDQLGARPPEWFVGLAAAAIAAECWEEFVWRHAILLADGRRIEPPGGHDPQTLVRTVQPGGLGERLGVAMPLHPAYLGRGQAPRRVVHALEDWQMLAVSCDSGDEVLRVLARDHENNTIGRVRVDDDSLLELRDAFERLEDAQQRSHGERMGFNIELRGVTYMSGEAVETWCSPADAYLPATIDRERDSFAKAAAATAALAWLHPSYARVLKHAKGRHRLGAQRFLVRLGAMVSPRLTAPPDEEARWKRDTRPASRVSGVERPQLQLLPIRALTHSWDRFLLGDRWSPDLQRVIADIRADRDAKRRRRRGLMLLGVLARAWDRHYADHIVARAVYGYDGYWHDPHPVMATWLARAATAEWLPSATGALRAPCELALPTPANRLAYGGERRLFLHKIDDQLLRSPALEALRVRRGPSASDLVARLHAMKAREVTREAESEARLAYRLLAHHCTSNRREHPVDDMSQRDFRAAFARGLLLIGGDWRTLAEVFTGEPIFGTYRLFVSRAPDLAPLWTTLRIMPPDAADCVAVLRELAARPLARADRGVMLETLRALAADLPNTTVQFRSGLKKLPLWTRRGWHKTRPVFAFEDDALAEQAAAQVPVWDVGFATFEGLERLLECLDVRLVRDEEFAPVRLSGEGAIRGEELRPQFALAARHLADELTRGDQALHDSIGVRWEALLTAAVVIDPNLRIAADTGGTRIAVDANAAMLREPPILAVREKHAVGDPEAGGRALASLFSGDRQKVAWAWAAMWQRAGEGSQPRDITLARERPDEDEGTTGRLLDLRDQAAARGRRGKPAQGRRTATGSRPAVKVQRLKDIADYAPDGGQIVNRGESRSGVIFPTTRPRTRPEPGEQRTAGGPGTPPRPRTTPAPMTERQQLALDAVQSALRLRPDEIVDLCDRRGIGADAMDDLRQLYEIKMESGAEFPSEITLTRMEVKAAQDDEDFFLAVVTGLSDDAGELRVRFLFRPLERLAVRLKGEATLSGVHDVEALEYRFQKVGA